MRAALSQDSPASNFAKKSGVLHQKWGFCIKNEGFMVYNTPPKVDKTLTFSDLRPQSSIDEKIPFFDWIELFFPIEL